MVKSQQPAPKAEGKTTSSFLTFNKIAIVVILFEIVMNALIIRFVPYTEIDWKAYMQEVSGVLVDNEWNYMELKGDTGPLVYPAGFVWLYSALYYITDNGENILKGQIIFGVLNVCFTAVVLLIYKEAQRNSENTFPSWIVILLALSKRIHSIFGLRLFNDCWAMFFLYLSILMFTKHRFYFGSIFITFALSIKMNILLFLPPLLVIYVKSLGVVKTLVHLSIIFVFQVLVGLPFLLHNHTSYLVRSFDFGREFMYIWTVNLKFLPEEIFLSSYVSRSLLIGHLGLLTVFGLFKWCNDDGGAFKLLFSSFKFLSKSLNPTYIVNLLFVGNFIGIIFARSLHYQFYVWYFHTLPFVLWSTPYPTFLRVLFILIIEVVWNVYPSNFYSSLTLCCIHFLIMVGLVIGKVPTSFVAAQNNNNNKQKNK